MNVIKEIGPEKIVQVITDNAYVMKAIGSLLKLNILISFGHHVLSILLILP